VELHLPTERDVDAWQIAVWNLPDDLVSRPQKFQFMLMLDHRFNNFDPFMVVGDLLRRRDWWKGAVMERAHIVPDPEEKSWWGRMVTDLIKLRDISQCWNVDHLFILTDTTRTNADWQDVVQEWNADDVGFIEGDNVQALLCTGAGKGRYKILRIWWD
jgi:hypothetical protein